METDDEAMPAAADDDDATDEDDGGGGGGGGGGAAAAAPDARPPLQHYVAAAGDEWSCGLVRRLDLDCLRLLPELHVRRPAPAAGARVPPRGGGAPEARRHPPGGISAPAAAAAAPAAAPASWEVLLGGSYKPYDAAVAAKIEAAWAEDDPEVEVRPARRAHT